MSASLVRRLLPLLMVLGAASAWAEASWEVVTSAPILIKSRPRQGTGIREVWAEGDMHASVADLQFALLDYGRYVAFMPYMKETREVAPRDPDDTRYVYSRLQLPIVGGRDYVLKVAVNKLVRPDGSGTFMNSWTTLPTFVPVRPGIKRLQTNEGSWTITPKGERLSHAVYRFAVDPGGWLPPFAADFGNKTATEDTWNSVEKEAQRHATQPKTQARPAVPRPLESPRP